MRELIGGHKMNRNHKDEVRRLMAKVGWLHGHSGRPGRVPFADTGTHVPLDEERAYWIGYHDGIEAPQDALNPWDMGRRA